MLFTPLWVLSLICLILCLLGWIEYRNHQATLATIPLRIHVNGTRGKSSVTRLIAAGLRAGGLKTFAKVTGTAPRVIDDQGRDRIIHRLRGASIGEQVRILRYFSKERPDAVVIECMAVQPQYQWLAEQKMVKSHIGVITNSRPDHLDEMGPTLEDVTRSLCNTIPFNAKFYTAEAEQQSIMARIAKKRGSEFAFVSEDTFDQQVLSRFSYVEHPQNVALALKVCEAAGVSKEQALSGMVKVKPDLGSLQVWRLNINDKHYLFVNGMAANDPVSTYQIWKMVINRYPVGGDTCIFLNTREDRRSRTFQLLEMIYENIRPQHLLIRGANLDHAIHFIENLEPGLIPTIFSPNSSDEEVIQSLKQIPDDSIIYAVGNQVGAGQRLLDSLKRYRSND
ncbi:MAG: poly-gamma-glutamate synthase PgsB [FCB group bacterium]|nr:poly-gamma-glutamate synthase PgsB [FCB group bacterium]